MVRKPLASDAGALERELADAQDRIDEAIRRGPHRDGSYTVEWRTMSRAARVTVDALYTFGGWTLAWSDGPESAPGLFLRLR